MSSSTCSYGEAGRKEAAGFRSERRERTQFLLSGSSRQSDVFEELSATARQRRSFVRPQVLTTKAVSPTVRHLALFDWMRSSLLHFRRSARARTGHSEDTDGGPGSTCRVGVGVLGSQCPLHRSPVSSGARRRTDRRSTCGRGDGPLV